MDRTSPHLWKKLCTEVDNGVEDTLVLVILWLLPQTHGRGTPPMSWRAESAAAHTAAAHIDGGTHGGRTH